ncbi:hypothetical protein OYT88_02255 [Sporolactobacillus sp. CQH2019]|uniref:hypothetical protein n=1 Tax=Sporolactobacillus sp. CQH2019 TaxID=3023512 RepID=UPI002368B356|nr:hypothetical protein [Sporolactobacillus sp. CQH2019]MDD9147372.1 hypothetical protein [Sporolactobacillus sp. CQH2019]
MSKSLYKFLEEKSNPVIKFPKIGDNVESFISYFGKPIKDNNETLISFDFDVKDSSYFIIKNLHRIVNNISFSLNKSNDELNEEFEVFGRNFLPDDCNFIKRVDEKVIPIVNGDEPISIFEYYSNQLKESSRYFKQFNDNGYVTFYLSKGIGIRFVVALGKEDAI